MTLLVAVVAGYILTNSFLELQSLSSINTFFQFAYPSIHSIVSWPVGMSVCSNNGVAK